MRMFERPGRAFCARHFYSSRWPAVRMRLARAGLAGAGGGTLGISVVEDVAGM